MNNTAVALIMRVLIILFLAASRPSPAAGQIAVYGWRDHFSWNTAENLTIAGKKVYCSNGAGICIYDMTGRKLEKLTKVNGLNGAGITAVQHIPATSAVAIGYASGNLDIVTGNSIHNIPDIKLNRIHTDRRINSIYVSGSSAYLSCAFGIVVIDMQLRQIRDSYIIGNSGQPVSVTSLTEYGGYFYAATAHGLKKADTRSRLLTDFSTWETVSGMPGSGLPVRIVSTDQYLYVCDSDNRIFAYSGATWKSLPPPPYPVEKIHNMTLSGNSLLVSAANAVLIYSTATNLLQNIIQSYGRMPAAAFDAAMDSDGTCWIADNRQGLVQWRSAGSVSFHVLPGPASNNAAALRFKAGRLMAVSGGRDGNGAPLNRRGELHVFHNSTWTSICPPDARDFTDVDISIHQPDTYCVSSWGQGVYMLESSSGTQKAHYTQYSSSLTADYEGRVLCGGLLLDNDSKLWVSNDKNISLLAAGQWKPLSWETVSGIGRLTEDSHGQIWATQGYSGLLVFDKTAAEQGQNDAKLSFKPNSYTGTVPINISNGIACTADGVIWVATSQGPVYYQNPAAILNGGATGGTHPNRTGASEPDFSFALLGSENILSMAIDGAHRKWFGTATAGVFLIDEDNSGEVKHFTEDNSPLPSNRVHDIAIDDRTGEVFFATEHGIMAYRSDATAGGDDFGKVYAFPNPVRPEYQGNITITGLISDASVKITDISGNLVYETRTLGGQAVWNGQNLHGRRVATGVYLVFITNDDGSKTAVTKILFIH